MKRAEVVELFTRLREINPHPVTELAYSTPYELLVAVVLSAQATDVGVNKATRRLYPVANTARAMVDLAMDGLKRYISSIGLFNTKAKNVIALSRLLVEQHGGQVPDTRAALEALPGVGRKSANVILNVAFGQPTIAVDTQFSGSPTVPGWRRAKTYARSRTNWNRWYQRSSSWMHITGWSCMAATCARHANRTARIASSATCVATNSRLSPNRRTVAGTTVPRAMSGSDRQLRPFQRPTCCSRRDPEIAMGAARYQADAGKLAQVPRWRGRHETLVIAVTSSRLVNTSRNATPPASR